jgi:hypothetical protein
VSSGRRLSPAHKRRLFEESGIGARVAVKRGYRTVKSKSELERFGFGRSQRNVPALLIPIYGATGEIILYQSRQRSKLAEADRLGLVIRWSEYPTWVELHDPLTGDRHEVRASECLPGVIETADRYRKKKGQ